GKILCRSELHRAVEDHPLLFCTETHKPTFCAAGNPSGDFPDRNAKYSAARSRLSSFPVSMIRATRWAETITGVIPPPGCVQCPTRYRFLTVVVFGSRPSASCPGDISQPSMAPCQLLVKRYDVIAVALNFTAICESM